MTTSGRQGNGPDDSASEGATEPITLTDPDGAVTRVAPWSSWTREQVRAPGGEPALVTRLDQGQLWFSAGRRRSPWRHEVHVGPAVVSTPRGRFQAVAEPDGGATIACLAGRTRVVAGLREPVLLGPDQSAAVSSDGRTLVVMDRASGAEIADPEIAAPEVIDLTESAELDDVELVELATVGAIAADAVGSGGAPAAPLRPYVERPEGPAAPPEPLPYHDEDRPARLGWIPELVAVLAIVGLLAAGLLVFTRDGGDGDLTAAPVTTLPIATTEAPTTTEADPTTAVPTTTAAPTTAVVATTEAPKPPAATGATAVGELQGCRRGEGGVVATVSLSHRSGPRSTFRVTASLVDANGNEFASGSARTDFIEPGGTAAIEVLVRADVAAQGSCELREVTSA